MRLLSALLLAVLLAFHAGCVAEPPSPAPRAPAPVAVAWGGEEAPIHPGVRIGDEAFAGLATGRTGGCTGAFLFTDLDGNAYVSTAAHCLAGDDMSVAGVARARVAYCSFAAGGGACSTDPASGDRNDFGLLQLAPGDVGLAHPSVRGAGGPRSLAACDDLAPGARVVAYGNSSYKPDGAPLREMQGEFVSYDGAFMITVRFTTPAIPADSGSPVLDGEGRALGIMRALNPDGTNTLTCLEAALAAMAEAGGPAVDLAKPYAEADTTS